LVHEDQILVAMVYLLANREVSVPFLLVEVAPLVVLAACLRFLLVVLVVG